jgi:N-acyl-D-amino-acid deacylase
MWNYLIKNGFVVDGTGAPWFRADVAIEGEKIADIRSNLPVSKADTVLDAKGMVVAPGYHS